MKIILIAAALLSLVGCSSLPPPLQPNFLPYVEPVIGQTAKVKIINGTDKFATLWVFTERAKCKEPHYVSIDPHQSKSVSVAANETKLFQVFYSISYVAASRHTTSCAVALAYKPTENSTYEMNFASTETGCTLAVRDSDNRPVNAERVATREPFFQARHTGEWCE